MKAAFFLGSLAVLCFQACIFETKVSTQGTPSELEFNYWMLSRLYIHPEELTPIEAFEARGDSFFNAGWTPPANLKGLGASEYFSVMSLYSAIIDPFTRYVPPQKADEQKAQDTSTVIQGGVGVEMVWDPGPDSARIAVMRVYADSPAEIAGLQRNDRLLSSNGVGLQNDSAYELFSKILHDSLWIRLRVLRENQDSLDTLAIDVKRGLVYVPTVFLDTVANVPVIEVRQFVRTSIKDGGTDTEFHRALEASRGMGTRVIDLRGNPGGEIRVCLDMADEFIAEQPMVYLIVRSFDARGNRKIDTTGFPGHIPGVAEGERVILAVDSNTASCAEIFAGALKKILGDNAVLVGTRTYGKAIGQSHWDTPAGGIAVITNLQIRLPDGTDYQSAGIPADIAVDEGSILETSVRLAGNDESLPRMALPALKKRIFLREVNLPAPGGGAWMDSTRGF